MKTEIELYGCTLEMLKASILVRLNNWQETPDRTVVSILSEAQERIETGQANEAIQSINIVKWIVCQDWVEEENGELVWRERK